MNEFTEEICCNCNFYCGVHGCAGCAPCSLYKKMVAWNETCKHVWLIPLRLKVKVSEVKKTMTVRELKKLLGRLSSEQDDYIVTTENGHQGFDGEIYVDNEAGKININ